MHCTSLSLHTLPVPGGKQVLVKIVISATSCGMIATWTAGFMMISSSEVLRGLGAQASESTQMRFELLPYPSLLFAFHVLDSCHCHFDIRSKHRGSRASRDTPVHKFHKEMRYTASGAEVIAAPMQAIR